MCVRGDCVLHVSECGVSVPLSPLEFLHFDRANVFNPVRMSVWVAVGVVWVWRGANVCEGSECVCVLGHFGCAEVVRVLVCVCVCCLCVCFRSQLSLDVCKRWPDPLL